MDNWKILGVLAGGLILGATFGAGGVMIAKKSATGSSGMSAGKCSAEDGAGGGYFTFKGKSFSRESLPQDVQSSLYDIESRNYQDLFNFLREYALRLEIMEKKGIKPVENVMPAIPDLLKVADATDPEVADFLKSRGIPMPTDPAQAAQIKEQVKAALRQQKVHQEIQPYLAALDSFKMGVLPPEAPFVELNTKGILAKGPDSAPVKMVVASDYLCPHCRVAKKSLDDIVKDLGDKVQLIPIPFPLSTNGLNMALAVGAYCAMNQSPEGYWKYHDEADTIQPEAQQSVSPDKEKAFRDQTLGLAKKAGLDLVKFEKCQIDPASAKWINEKSEMLRKAGVRGTPTIYLNGRKTDVAPQNLKEAVAKLLNNVK